MRLDELEVKPPDFTVTNDQFRRIINHLKQTKLGSEGKDIRVKNQLIDLWDSGNRSASKLEPVLSRVGVNINKVLKMIGEDSVNQLVAEGGNAFPGVGAIHVSEIEPTLAQIERGTNLSDIKSRVLGSVGKKEYSGDIDIAVEPKNPEELGEFIDSLRKLYGDDGVRKIGALITTKVPIANYDETKDGRQPRTGYVQTDYIFGNPEWLKLYFHSPSSKDSALKGTHRNIGLATVAGFVDREESEEEDGFGRPVSLQRWKWSPANGLVKVRRNSYKNDRTGKWVKAQKETELSEPVQSADDIAKILFKGTSGREALNSAESIINAVKRAYDEPTAEKIFKTMADNFSTHTDIGDKEWDYPEEISRYMEPVSK